MRTAIKGVVWHQLSNLVLFAIGAAMLIAALAASGCASQVAFGDINASYYHAVRHAQHERVSYSAADRASLDRLVARTSVRERPKREQVTKKSGVCGSRGCP